MRAMQAGDVYAIYAQRAKKYGAVQIIEVQPDGVSAVTLDYIEDCPPKENKLKRLKPLYTERWFFDHRLEYRNINSSHIPENYIYLGTVKPVIKEKSNTYGGWTDEAAIEGEAAWRALPAWLTKPFKKAQKDTREITIGGIVCRRSFSGAGDNILSSIQSFSELDALAALSRIRAGQYYDGLIPYLREKPLIRNLVWMSHGQKQLDFRGTHIQELELDATGLERVYLCGSLHRLELSGSASRTLEIVQASDGWPLILDIKMENDILPAHLPGNIVGLGLKEIGNFDLAQITDCANVEWLRLFGRPGNVENIACLEKLSGLKRLYLQDIFGFFGEEFPAPETFPKLEDLALESVPEEAGKSVRQKYKGKVAALHIVKLRKPEWLNENLNNPFRNWDGSEFVPKGKAKKAAEIYKKTRKEMLETAGKRPSNADDMAELQSEWEASARAYGVAFNKLQGKTEFIETEEREEIYAALEIIITDAKALFAETIFQIDEEAIYHACDAVRDW